MSVLITGANGGLGIAIAERFLEDPEAESRVWLGLREGRDRAEALAARFPDRCSLVTLDVTDGEAWNKAIQAIVEADGRLEVLVNNAGFHRDALLATMEEGDWNAVIEANLNAVFLGCRSVVRQMMSQRYGRLINIASLSALLAPLGQSNYAAAKAGVVALTQSLAKEVGRSGITANAICPGYIETEALSAIPDVRKKEMRAGIPMRNID
ncbi:MAG: SDR family NAD(P)-dependent oxidoreductase [Verrucomicrobiota bacterium]